MESFHVCGLSMKLSRSQNQNSKLIRDLWQRFNRELSDNNINLGKNWKKYGITYQEEGYYFYMAAIPLDQSISNFSTIEILGGAFVCFQHKGSMDLLKRSYFDIYKKRVPQSNLSIDRNRPILHYEVYDNRFNWNNTDSVIDLIIPTK